jgi:subtilase family serine protease
MLMRRNRLRYFVGIVFAIVVARGIPAQAQRLENNVSPGVKVSKDLGPTDSSSVINIAVHYKLGDKTAFDAAVDALYNPASPNFHKWMTNAELRKYSPPEEQQERVRRELQKHGLKIISSDSIGFTVHARGTIAQVEDAFDTEIHTFEHNGEVFRANVRNARLRGEAGNYVSTVAGIESHQVRPLATQGIGSPTPVPLAEFDPKNGFPPFTTTDCLSAPITYSVGKPTKLPYAVYTGTEYHSDTAHPTVYCDYLPSQLLQAYGWNDVLTAGYDGSGQTIVLVEAYGYPTLEADANAFSKLANLPSLDSSNFSLVYPEGKPKPGLGVESGWNYEIALDLDWAHTFAPGAKIVEVITNGQDNEDFQDSILYAAENNLGNSVSNSYEEDIDLYAGPLEQTSWDETIEVATAKGISVNFSSGDHGDNGLGTPIGAPMVPSVAPHATAVGGTSILNDLYNPGDTITTGWGNTAVLLGSGDIVTDPPYDYVYFLAGGGGGKSVFWPKPAWQQGVQGKARGVPDVSTLADPQTGVPIVITVDKVQSVEFHWGGTSLSCPIFSAMWAIANEVAGSPLGQAAPAIASLPSGGVQDVLPTTDSSPYNVTGYVTDQSGTTDYTAAELFGADLYGTTGFTSTLWVKPEPPYDFGFGLDSSLTVRKGWDEVTGYGTPYGLAFINAVMGK